MSISKLVLGLWPIAGVTTVGVTERDARDTLAAAIEHGVTAFDTAYSYGFDGESDRLLGEFIGGDRDRFTIMGKVGQRWDDSRSRVVDGSARQLTLDAEESLARLGLECFDVLYLHAPDPSVDIETSASAMKELQSRGLCRRVGICNATLDEIDRFASVVSTHAVQCPLNMIQPDSLNTQVQPNAAAGRQVYVFWALMKGLLAGKIKRDHRFAEGDSRPGYPIFQGDYRQRVHDVLDRVADVAGDHGQTIAQLSIGWAISQPGVTGALVGARRPEQILETIGAREMDEDTIQSVNSIVESCFDEGT